MQGLKFESLWDWSSATNVSSGTEAFLPEKGDEYKDAVRREKAKNEQKQKSACLRKKVTKQKKYFD